MVVVSGGGGGNNPSGWILSLWYNDFKLECCMGELLSLN